MTAICREINPRTAWYGMYNRGKETLVAVRTFCGPYRCSFWSQAVARRVFTAQKQRSARICCLRLAVVTAFFVPPLGLCWFRLEKIEERTALDEPKPPAAACREV